MRTRCIVAAVTAAAAVAVPVPASAAVTGSVTFNCTATLDDGWPTAAGSGYCDEGSSNPQGDGPAFAVVEAGGLDDWGSPFIVHGFAPLRAEFTYQEACVVNEPPLAGTASGTARIEGLPAVHNGVASSATLVASFQWTRFGATAALTITSFQFTFLNNRTATGSAGEGQATFVPRLDSSHTCPVGGWMEALVTGEANLVI